MKSIPRTSGGVGGRLSSRDASVNLELVPGAGYTLPVSAHEQRALEVP